FSRMDSGSLRSKVRSLGPKDWRDRWQLYFHTMPLGRKFTIVPVWESQQFKESPLSGRRPLFLDPCGAFGSGAHETTRLMIRMMEPLEGKFDSFLDIGTGTGILAAAAAKLGACRVVGIDIEPASAAAARRNFKLNGGRDGVFRAEDIQTSSKRAVYDVVAANFISADLVTCQKAIMKHVGPKGVLLLSGISLRNLPVFLRTFKTPGFRKVRLFRGRSWAGLIYRRAA
ncbi:MAG: 50S ribosomal protein L11 methyltransferase, partial [Candidatus Omnitrophica bacterium]|nr:50S ribosomal protein L11 methyltransferase [Candidatus Omnitrophota bacterium]